MSKIESVVKTLGETLGVNPEDIRVQAADWTRYMNSGVVVDLHIRRWRGVTRLSLEDLGLDKDESEKVVDELIRLGDKFLMPPAIVRELNSIDTGARKCLERYGYRLIWGRFLPAASYLSWKEENDKFVFRYYSIRDRIVEFYDEYRLQMIENYAKAARAAYHRAAKISGLSEAVEDVFVERFVDRVIGLIPSRDQIRDSFSFEVELSFIPLPSLLAEDQAEKERIDGEAAIERERRYNEIRAERELTAAEIQMRRDVLESAKSQKENLVNNFMKDVVSQLNQALYDAVSDVLATTEKNGSVHPRSVVQLESLIEKIRGMNFFGYDEIDKMISETENIVRTNPGDRKIDDVTAKLRDIATVTRSTLIGLGDRPRSARKVGVPDVVTPEIVRTARGRLGILAENVEVETIGERRKVRTETI